MANVVFINGSQPSVWIWLGPVLGLGGSILVALLALGGVLWTNSRTDRREFTKWRRDTLLRIAAEALESSLDAQAEYRIFAESEERRTRRELRTAIETSVRRINSAAGTFALIDAKDSAAKCSELHDSLLSDGLEEAALEINSARASADPQAATNTLLKESF
ncbi:hypothetical protein [Mycolicibacterium mengxianglii]|uniref:hypothetical protein n=1 Tax=Mycolicibacterium mengxianglii TaxID=2736649 RepID=UPI0018EEEA86|nr:hypothetical protein [Mycolicibacterium mengxianglii]